MELILDPFDERIINARVCPYCGRKPEYVDSSCVYTHSYGMIYRCSPCDAHVGVHHGTTRKALGRLADKDLRFWKKEAHAHFDPLWKRAIKQGRSKKEARFDGYTWLSRRLSLPMEHTHIGMMDVEYCKKVVEICKPYL